MKRAFWISAMVFFLCVNSLAAVLYAGVRPLDGGGGFISLSPLIDCVFWGVPIAVSALLTCFFGWKARPRLPAIPGALRFPAAYLAMTGGLSVLILVMGMCGLLYRFSAVHLPVWGYIGLMGALYVLCGFRAGQKWGGPLWSAPLWGCALAAAFGLIGSDMLRWAAAREIVPVAVSGELGTVIPMGTETLIRRGPLGWLLGRLNLPACLLMSNYDYAQYGKEGVFSAMSREMLVMLACLVPPALFTVSWLAGRVKRGREGAPPGPESRAE